MRAGGASVVRDMRAGRRWRESPQRWLAASEVFGPEHAVRAVRHELLFSSGVVQRWDAAFSTVIAWLVIDGPGAPDSALESGCSGRLPTTQSTVVAQTTSVPCFARCEYVTQGRGGGLFDDINRTIEALLKAELPS